MRRWVSGHAGIALGFVLGAVIATAATAGAASLITGKQIKDGSISRKDLSKAVRAELARARIPGPKGDAGPAGANGSPGVPGPVGPAGPTDAAVASPNPDPPATPEITFNTGYERTITTTKPGRLFVQVTDSNVTLTCSSGAGYTGLYLDGKPVPGSNMIASTATANNFSNPVTLFGLTGVVAAGSHTVNVGYDCPQGTWSTEGEGSFVAAAIVIGG